MTNEVTLKGIGFKRALRVGAFTSLAALAIGCSASPEEPSSAGEARSTATTAADLTGSTLSAFELARPQHAPSELGDRAGKVAAAFGAGSAALRAAVAGAHADTGSVHAALAGGIKVSHVDGNDSLQMLDETVTRDTGSSLDVGPSATGATFLSVFKSLVASGAVTSTGLDPASANLAKLMQGEGASGQSPLERVKEYVYRVPRMLNGIEVFGAGVDVSVHRNGKLARVKLYGPTVHSHVAADGTETPTAAGATFTAALGQAAADKRANADYPNAALKSIGLRYWLPEGAAQAVVAPAYLYLVTPVATLNGEQVKARGFYVGYSTRDAGGAPTVWPHAAPNAKGDSGK
jgi:hypothetical protein